MPITKARIAVRSPILSKKEAAKRFLKLPKEDRLYPTVKEEREYRALKEKYGL